MSIDKRPAEPWDTFLKSLDSTLTEITRMDCIGGFVVTNVHGMLRETGDLDVLDVAAAGNPHALQDLLLLGGMGSPLHRKHGIYLEKVGIAPVPYEYESRLTKIFPDAYEHLVLLAADPYDLALSKIERNSRRDRDDVAYLGWTVPLDVEVLEDRYKTELRYLLGVPTREDLTLKLWIEMILDAQAEKWKAPHKDGH